MSVIKISATRINVFLECKKRYWFQYKKRYPKMSNPAFRLGIACHRALEFAGSRWKEKGELTKEDIKDVLEKYDVISVVEGIEEYGIHLEGRALVKMRASNFMSGKKILALEKKFGFHGDEDVFVNDIPLIGAIDKVEEIDSNTVMIVDYKTSKTSPTPDQMRGDMQLSLYDLAARQLWPGYETVILCLDMLKGNMQYTYRTDEDRELFLGYLDKVHVAMNEFEEKDAKPSLNMFCPWCDFNDYCDAYKKACNKDNYSFETATKFDDDTLINEWIKVRSTQKILSSRESSLAMIVTEKIKKQSGNLKGEDSEIYIRQNARTTYDTVGVFNNVEPEVFVKLVSGINKRSLENYVSDNPALRKKMAATSTTNYTAPFLASKKIKK